MFTTLRILIKRERHVKEEERKEAHRPVFEAGEKAEARDEICYSALHVNRH